MFSQLLCLPCTIILISLVALSFLIHGAAEDFSQPLEETLRNLSEREFFDLSSSSDSDFTEISSCSGTHPAQDVTFNIETETHYILCSPFAENTWLKNLIDADLPRAILTFPAYRVTLIDTCNTNALLSATQEPGNPVIIALNEYAPCAAEVTQKIASEKSLKKIHSIILINPTVTDALQNPIKIDYDAINYRVYNFFGRDFGLAYNYKIIPCNEDQPLSRYDNKLFMKGVNICCYHIDKSGFAQSFPFFKWAYCGTRRTAMSLEFIIAASHIIKTIKNINNNFRLNTNLECVLQSTFPYSGYKDARPDIPSLQALPFIHIYRHIEIDCHGSLHSTVTTKSQITKTFEPIAKILPSFCCTSSTGSGALEFTTLPLAHDDITAVYTQLKAESLHNALMLSQAPYFKEFCLAHREPLSISSIINNQHIHDIAHVRCTHSLCSQEKQYVAKRKLLQVKPALESVFRKNIREDKIPTIAIVASGGGIRATLTTFGALKGLDKIGLLNAVTYVSALSGSTWAVNSWLSTGKSLDETCDYITQQLPLLTYTSMVKTMASLRLADQPSCIRNFFGQSSNYTDYYGSLLLNGLLGIDTCSTTVEIPCLSQQLTHYEHSTDRPFPIYTAIAPSINPEEKYTWYEFTPYEVGQVWGDSPHYIPTWALGRQFESSYSQDFAPEISLGTLMGTFGSAFGATLEEILQKKQYTHIASLCPQPLLKHRASYTQFHNPTHNMNIATSNRTTLDLIDAGIHCNLPYPPISGLRPERKPDIIIFVDASENKTAIIPTAQGDESFTVGRSMQQIQELFVRPHENKGISFPNVPAAIEYHWGPAQIHTTSLSIGDIPCSVFVDHENLNAPAVIYLPLVKCPSLLNENRNTDTLLQVSACNHNIEFDTIKMADYGTTNFAPSIEQAQQLVALMEFNVRAHEDKLKACIRDWIDDTRTATHMVPSYQRMHNRFTINCIHPTLADETYSHHQQ